MFYGFVITESGNALLASMVAGQTMTITKAVVGEGTADNPDAARKLTDLITPGPTATSTRPTVDGNSVNMIVEYRSDLNGGLKEGFWIGEFGIFGKVGDGEEAMIGYGSLGDAKQYVSAYVEGTAPDVRRYPVSITVTTGVQVNVDYPAEAWMTAEDVDDKVNKHNSSEKSHQDIRASLSNKVSLPIKIPSDADLNDYTNPGLYWVGNDNTAATISNSPTTHAFSLIVEKGPNGEPVQTLKTWIDAGSYRATVFVRSGYPNWESGWQKFVSATPPQEYDMPLDSGWTTVPTSHCVYSKDQFGMVRITLAAMPDEPVSENTRIAVLPAGFRPAVTIYRFPVVSTTGTVGFGYITGSGELGVWPFGPMKEVSGSFQYIVKD